VRRWCQSGRGPEIDQKSTRTRPGRKPEQNQKTLFLVIFALLLWSHPVQGCALHLCDQWKEGKIGRAQFLVILS
jgi:hypothetical protein